MVKDTPETILVGLVGRAKADKIFKEAQKFPDPRARRGWIIDLIRLLTVGDTTLIDELKWLRPPVSPRQFLCDPFYLGKESEVYPSVLEDYEELNCGEYDEAVLTGGIGSAKTTLAIYTQAYQLYLLSCMKSPQQSFGLDSGSELKIIFQSLRKSTAVDVDYTRFKTMVDASPYFNEMYPRDKSLNSKMVFPNRIEVEAVSGSETASIGQNIIGGIIDEINFMAVIKNSKTSVDGGVYNQAVELYNSIARRRKSRFMSAGGRMAGILCVVSSKRIPEEFTDKKMAEAKTNKRIFVYDKRVWDVKPDSFCGETFKIFIGDGIRRPRLIRPDEVIPDADQKYIDHVPTEFEQEFKDDITKAVRDIAGHSTLATTPFLPNSLPVVNCFKADQVNLATGGITDFDQIACKIKVSAIENPHFPRYAHIDLAVSGDSAGLSIGHCPEFVYSSRVKGMMPVIKMDLVLEIKPPQNGEIEFDKVRSIILLLNEYGLNIKWVSLDSFQSRDTIQILRRHGIATGLLSLDTSMIPYETTKTALYDERVLLPEHALLQKELLALEVNYRDMKVDHNAHNTKDIADSVAGVIYGLTNRAEVWSNHGIPLREVVVDKLKTGDSTKTNKEAERA